MRLYSLLKWWSLGGLSVAAGHCVDIHSHIVSQGVHYVPGPNSCTVCICDKGSPKWCRSVLCSPPQDCQSFQVSNSCCEFKCLDDILGANGPAVGGAVGSGATGSAAGDTYDVALRLIASLITAVLSLSLLFFLIHRLRQRKSRHRAGAPGGASHSHQLADEHRHHHPYNGIGYITGSLGYLSGSVGYLGAPPADCDYPYNEAGYPLWKPAGGAGYFPRGEAPPPYEEAVRAARAESGIYCHQPAAAAAAAVASCDAAGGGGGNPVNLTLVHNTHVNITQQQQQQQQQRADERTSDDAHHHQQQQPPPAVQPQLRLVCRQSKSLLVNQVDVHSETGLPIVVLPAGGRKRTSAVASSQVAAGRRMPQQQSVGGTVSRREPRLHRTIPATVQATSVLVDTSTVATARHLRSRQVRSQPAAQPQPQPPPPPTLSAATIAAAAAAAAAVARRPADDSDLDDYRSECENCKSLSLENCSDELLNETMTLQRHPAEPLEPQPPFYRTSLTLPVHSKKLRTLNSAHRDSWFTPMQELSSSSDEE